MPTPETQRLGIFVDAPYHVVGGADRPTVTTVSPFLHFACRVAASFAKGALIGRTAYDLPARPVVLPDAPRLIALPYYANLREVGAFLKGFPVALRRIWRALPELDVVWVFNGGPMGLALVTLARLRRRRVVVGVRQQTDQYWRHRLRGRERLALGPALALSFLTDLITHGCDRTVVGSALADLVPRGAGEVLEMTILLATTDELATAARAVRRTDGRPVQLLTVGRIDAEKNPHLLVDALDRLERAAPGAYRLTWVGGGRMEEGVRAAVHDRGLGGIVDFAGYVPYGPRLLDLYRSADLFVHVSLTEGVPQVLLEAMACGTPIVATAVGGVTRATEGGRAARLVPAGDLAALVAAIENAVSGPDETFARATAGLQIARMHALDVEAARVATFLAG